MSELLIVFYYKFVNINYIGGKEMRFLSYVKIMIVLFLTISLFYSCDDDDSNPTENNNQDNLIGEWTLVKVAIPSMSMELTPEQAGFMINGELKNDGTFSMTTTDSTGSITETGDWSTSNSTLIMSYEDGRNDQLEYTVSGDEITLTSLIEMQGIEIMAELTFRKE